MPVDLDGDGKADIEVPVNVIGMAAGGECEFIDAIKVNASLHVITLCGCARVCPATPSGLVRRLSNSAQRHCRCVATDRPYECCAA